MRKKLLWIFLIMPLILSTLNINTTNVNAQEIHNIAVTSVTPSSTLVKLNELVDITVAVENKGTENETFDVAVYYDNITIETKTVQNLIAGASINLTFTWNTTDVREEIYGTDNKHKVYTINATASTVPGETNTEDNTLLSPSLVTVIAYYIAIIPESIMDPTLTPGKNFTVSIYTDYNGSDIWSWSLELSYNPLVLHGIEVTNGDLITTDKDPSARFTAGTFDNEAGTLSLTVAYFFFTEQPAPLTSGPGILANITFTVVGTGDSDIILDIDPTNIESGVNLIGRTEGGYGKDYKIIDYHTPASPPSHLLNGFFQNIEAVTHDIAITNVTPFPTSVVEGELVNITVVVENQGTVAETFVVEVYYDYDPAFPEYRRIGAETVPSLTAGANKSFIFIWNTTGITTGDFTITAVISELLGETDTEDNTFIDGTVIIKAPEEQTLPILLIIIGIAAIVAIVVIIYAIRQR